MLPAIAVILWCNLLAVLGNGYFKVIALDAPAKKATARSVFAFIAIITLGLASWQTAEVVREGFEVRERLEQAEKPYQPLWGTKGLPTERSSGAGPNRNLP